MKPKYLYLLSIFFFALTLLSSVSILYAYHVSSQYPGFVVRWFGPSYMGMNLQRLLRIASMVTGATCVLSLTVLWWLRKNMSQNSVQIIPQVPEADPTRVVLTEPIAESENKPNVNPVEES